MLEVAGDGLKNMDVGLHIKADLLRHLFGDVYVARDNRSARRVAQRENRHSTVDDKRQNSCGSEEQYEPRRNSSQFVFLAPSLATCHSAIVGRMSLPDGAITWNRRLTARVVSPSARK